MKIIFQNLILLLSFVAYNYFCLAKDNIKVGVFFNKDQSNDIINWNIIQEHIDSGVEFEQTEIIEVPETDSFDVTKIVCNATAFNGYSALFGPRHPVSSKTIESICSTFQIPYIFTHWTPASTKQNPTSFNLYPEANLFSQGLATIVKSFDWKDFIVIYENEESLGKLQEVLKIQLYEEGNEKNNVLVKHLGPGPDYRPLLKDVTKVIPRKIILDCHVDKIVDILTQGKEVKLLDDFSTTIFLTSLDAHTVDFQILNKVYSNITTIRLFDPYNKALDETFRKHFPSVPQGELRVETALQHDAMLLFAKWINTLKETYPDLDFSSETKLCNSSEKYIDQLGLIKEMEDVKVTDGMTGAFTIENGKRQQFSLEVIEINPRNSIAFWDSENPEDIHLLRNATQIQEQFKERMKIHEFIVSSKLGKPYLMLSNIQGAVGNDRYRGFSKDLIDAVSKEMNISYTFILADANTADNIIRDLKNRKADLGICDFTITQQRTEEIDFSLPFMSLGISILHKELEQEEIDNMYAFMRPFSWTVWIYIITLYLLQSIIIFFIARLDPDDWENPHPCNQSPEELENIWGIKNCLWLTLGSIMTQGCDILPKGICSRTATAMWWFFSLIMASTYTANLAAFLTMSRKDDSIRSVEDLANQNKIKYGVMSGGSTQTFFEFSNESLYQKMWATMKNENPSVFEDNNDKGVERVLNTKKGLYAFFMESPQIEYELERNCELKKIGQYLVQKSYGIGMPLGAEYRREVNEAVLRLKESDKVNELKKKWWTQEDIEGEKCLKGGGEDNKDELTLANVGGAFVVLGAGIGLAFVFAIVEFLWNVHSISVDEHMTYFEALKWEVKFACNVKVTKKAAKPVISESSSSKSDDDKSMARTILAGAGSFLNINASVLNRLGQLDHET